MGTVQLDIGGKSYAIGCEDGGEDHLRELAARIDVKARLIVPQSGAPGVGRLMLMAALMIADELDGAQADLVEADARLATLRRDYKRLEGRAADALEAAASRLEAMATEESLGPYASDVATLVAEPPGP
jgi:cell division protein ZapA